MIHDHARGLHQGIADRRADKCEPGFFQTFAHLHGGRRYGRHFAAILEMIDLRDAADKRPEQRHRVLQRHPGLGIAPCGVKFETVADDPRIEHQIVYFGVAHLRHPLYIEAEQHLTVALALPQHGDPGQAGLEPFEQKQLEQALRIA